MNLQYIFLYKKFLKRAFGITLLSVTAVSFSAYSQEQTESVDDNEANAVSAQVEPSAEQEPVETITVEGQNSDAALRAFNAGDFITAEVQFKKNALCALRFERSKQALIDGLQTSSIDQNVQGVAGRVNTQTAQGASESSAPVGRVFSGNSGGKSSNKDKKEYDNERTCENRAFQLYMTGLSQIQLGKQEEAEKNFKTAVFLNRNLYDAQFRLSLMEMIRGDLEDAEERYEDLVSILTRCKDCEAKAEIAQRVDFVKKALDGEINLR